MEVGEMDEGQNRTRTPATFFREQTSITGDL